ncbi:MAG: DNA phosphorothioation-dependent restriction protein DptF [Peptostreptococcaceae bacterium]|jgi:DNA phosphorothioation-dependent restriction protein DptF|nr:DNA phosphorothioation-dependent restriction protein DptF [Peptostreptococcaceae bacterium]
MENNCFISSLRKLKESSKEAVEGINEFSYFKEYMHVETEIQKELENKIDEALNSNNSRLIMICGSVGDGKSHLISYLRNKYPNKLNQFNIHNDATESDDFRKDYKEHLSERLENFKDKNLSNQSNEKFLLAINLGTLNNFIESNHKDEFRTLINFIDSKNILGNKLKENNTKEVYENFDFVNFSDYNMFELYEDGVKSQYIERLIDKIINKDNVENEFYKSYENTCKYNCENNKTCPIKLNYELLFSNSLKQEIIKILIEGMLKYKLIISTRALLNFIYDLIVPLKLDKLSNKKLLNAIEKLDKKDFVTMLMPYSMYERKDSSNILKTINLLDPINYRKEEIDNLILELNIRNNYNEITDKYISLDFDGFLEESLDSIYEENMDLFSKFFIRSYKLLPKNDYFKLEDQIYNDFVKNIYIYNVNDKNLIKLYKNVEESIVNWYGKSSKNNMVIRIGKNQLNHKVIQNLSLRKGYENRSNIENYTPSKFEKSIELIFKNKEETQEEKIKIDYFLYKLLKRINDGYRPNKKDKNDFINFIKFIEKIISFGDMKKELIIEEKINNSNKKYMLLDEMGLFSFEEV